MAMKKKSRRGAPNEMPEEVHEQAVQRRERSMEEDLFDGDNPTTINESDPLNVTTGELTDVVAAIRDADISGEPTDQRLVPNINEMADRGVNATPAVGPAAKEEPADREEIETSDVEMAQANRSADRTKGAVEEKGVDTTPAPGHSVDENVAGEMIDETSIYMAEETAPASPAPPVPTQARRGTASRVRAHRGQSPTETKGHAARRKGQSRR